MNQTYDLSPSDSSAATSAHATGQTNAALSAPKSLKIKQLLREPLLHFAVLGALVFAADQALLMVRGDPQEIVVSTAVADEARQVFKDGMKRLPNAAEIKTLTDRWVDNEVLYREGLTLGLDKGDTSIRERVIFKALSVAQSGLALPAIDDAGLRAWFASKRKRYDEPMRFDFNEAVVTGDTSNQALQVFVAALNGAGTSDAQSSLRIFKDRPLDNLLESYGAEFADQIAKLAIGRWQLVQSASGPRVVRLEAIKPGIAANYEDIKVRVYQDWKDETTSKMTLDTIREMGKKYRVRVQEKAAS
jgi:PPIC-type PPIASE domain